jgi:hypothetical protein
MQYLLLLEVFGMSILRTETLSTVLMNRRKKKTLNYLKSAACIETSKLINVFLTTSLV